MKITLTDADVARMAALVDRSARAETGLAEMCELNSLWRRAHAMKAADRNERAKLVGEAMRAAGAGARIVIIPPPAIKPTIYVNLPAACPVGIGLQVLIAEMIATHGPCEVVFGHERARSRSER